MQSGPQKDLQAGAQQSKGAASVIRDLMRAGFDLYMVADYDQKQLSRALETQMPGHQASDYQSAARKVVDLFDLACKLAFRWANENAPGVQIDESTLEDIFLQELASKANGFSYDQYRRALNYGFDRAIF